mmetsp:Transcript_376/g.614  ORF Transcript_376/g.614 Transcript_376/m.614 type:complete len:148 (-) Transcript_376:1123-1566(-)
MKALEVRTRRMPPRKLPLRAMRRNLPAATAGSLSVDENEVRDAGRRNNRAKLLATANAARPRRRPERVRGRAPPVLLRRDSSPSPSASGDSNEAQVVMVERPAAVVMRRKPGPLAVDLAAAGDPVGRSLPRPIEAGATGGLGLLPAP